MIIMLFLQKHSRLNYIRCLNASEAKVANTTIQITQKMAASVATPTDSLSVGDLNNFEILSKDSSPRHSVKSNDREYDNVWPTEENQPGELRQILEKISAWSLDTIN